MYTKKIIHLTDLHIQPGQGKARNAKKAVDFIRKKYVPSDAAVVITGDIIEAPFHLFGGLDVYQAEFDCALRILSPLVEDGFDVDVLPGNHDMAKQGIYVSRDMRVMFAEFANRLCNYGFTPHRWHDGTERYPYRTFGDVGWAFMWLDTTVGQLTKDGPMDLARGNCGGEQLGDLDVFLDTYSEWHSGAGGHHGPHYKDWTNRLTDANELVKKLARGGAKLFLNGHKHQTGDKMVGPTRFLRGHQTTTSRLLDVIELRDDGTAERKKVQYRR